MNNNHNISVYIVCNNHHVYTDYFGPSEGYHRALAARCPRKKPVGVIPISASPLGCLCRGYSLITFANGLRPVDLQLFVRLFRKKKELGKARSKFGNRICKQLILDFV